MADHRRIRRLSRAVDDAAPLGGANVALAGTWDRFAALLDLHTRTEEQIRRPSLSGSGPGEAGRTPEAAARNDGIREAIGEARLQRAVRRPGGGRSAALAAADHVDRQAPVIRSEWAPVLSAERRRELGRRWLAFSAAGQQQAPPGPASGRRIAGQAGSTPAAEVAHRPGRPSAISPTLAERSWGQRQ